MNPTLPILTSCTGCRGSCCREQGSPPGYLYLLGKTPAERANWPDAEDFERIDSLPREALRILNRYSARLMRGETATVDGKDPPCCWLNQQTGECRFYEHRPQICRDELLVGDEACHAWREQYGIDKA